MHAVIILDAAMVAPLVADKLFRIVLCREHSLPNSPYHRDVSTPQRLIRLILRFCMVGFMDRQGCGIHFCHTHGMIILLSAGIMSRIIVSSAAQQYSCSPACPRCEQLPPTGRGGSNALTSESLQGYPRAL